MFLKMILYRIKVMFHAKESLFWSLAFPFILGSLFYFGFGNFMSDNELQKAIPIAVVKEANMDSNFVTVIEELSKEGENKLFDTNIIEESKAKEMLKNDEIDGYIYAESTPVLVVKETGINQTIINQVLKEYNRVKYIMTDLMSQSGMEANQMQTLMSEIMEQAEHTREISFGNGSMDTMLTYFYSLIAMVCIFGAVWGLDVATFLEPDISTIGIRRNVAPTHKLKIFIADLLGTLVVHMAEIILVLLYLLFILKIDFGNQFGFILLASLFGSLMGISLGIFFGILIKGKIQLKTGVIMGITMTSCFLSGLMVGGLPYIIEGFAPIINRINPCTVLVDCFYSLNIYPTLNTYFSCLFRLFIIAAIFITGAFLLVRRRRYASI